MWIWFGGMEEAKRMRQPRDSEVEMHCAPYLIKKSIRFLFWHCHMRFKVSCIAPMHTTLALPVSLTVCIGAFYSSLFHIDSFGCFLSCFGRLFFFLIEPSIHNLKSIFNGGCTHPPTISSCFGFFSVAQANIRSYHLMEWFVSSYITKEQFDFESIEKVSDCEKKKERKRKKWRDSEISTNRL